MYCNYNCNKLEFHLFEIFDKARRKSNKNIVKY